MKRDKHIFLRLFLTMFKIGLFTFGGGYAMIAVFENEFVSNKKWIEHEEFTDLIAIAESTPGPIAVNIATFVGATQGGVIGALCATLGIILPSFIIILVISVRDFILQDENALSNRSIKVPSFPILRAKV